MNKDYQYIFWDEQKVINLLSDLFPQCLQDWMNLDSIIKKCDAARYFILYQFGGIYADLDTTAYKPIDHLYHSLDISSFDIILCEENNELQIWKSEISRKMAIERNVEKVIGNAILISKRKQQFWLNFLSNAFKIKEKPVLKSFSTWNLTKFYEDSRDKYKIKILPAVYFMLSTYTDDRTISTHSYDATWFDNNKKKPWDV